VVLSLALLVVMLGCEFADAQIAAAAESSPSSDGFDLKGGYSVFSGTMADMTWPEIEAAANKQAIVLLPLGVIEEHGPHISCGADIYVAYLHCRLVKQELEKKGLPVVIAPPFYWGINTSTRNFPGSFDMKPETMKALLRDILANLKHWGFSEVYYVNSHGEAGHNLVLLESAQESRQNPGIRARLAMSDKMSRRFGLNGDEDHILLVDFDPPPGWPDVTVPDFHAGAEETGDMVAFFPDVVDSGLARTLKAPVVQEGGYGDWGQDARKVTPLGYGGDPAAYDANWSKGAILAYCHAIALAIEEHHKTGR
jgi:creatinine amidohydrolase